MGALGISVVIEVLAVVFLIAMLFMLVQPKGKTETTSENVITETDISASSPALMETAATIAVSQPEPEEKLGLSPIEAVAEQSSEAYRLSKSFTAKLVLADETLKERYSEIKNALLAYNNVKARTSWKHETFRCGRTVLARIAIKGKTLCLYLALSAEDIPDAKCVQSANKRKTNAVTPTVYKIKNPRRVKNAKRFIAVLSEKYGLIAVGRQTENFAPSYETEETLIAKGLIKQMKSTTFLQR